MPGVREEKERNERGYYTFDWFWVAMRPGVTVLETLSGHPEPDPYVVMILRGGTFVNPSTAWEVHYWQLNFNGTYLGRERGCIQVSKTDGGLKFDDSHRLIQFPEQEEGKSLDDMGFDNDVKQLILQGEAYWKLLTKQCRWYSGRTVDFPYNQIDANVMIDVEACLVGGHMAKPVLLGFNDLREWTSDCTCGVCKVRRATDPEAETPMFEDYNRINPQTGTERLTWHMMFLCPKKVPAFVFRTRTWEWVYVRDLSEPIFNGQMIDSLVMEPVQLRRLKALAQSFARIDKDGNQLIKQAWSADFVKGKGQGLIFLLHGRPGVGKTCTAECIAEFLQKPLMILTSTDVGTNPTQIESNLTREFKKAKSWGAVLLIDEADVFMEQRSTKDLTRNSLVAGFLRALEFYNGILFLTTNRVGAFDDAFISRIHVKLYYPDFTDDQRQQIWQTFVDKLKRDCGSYMKLDTNAKRYLKSAEVRAMKWNGRDIRNAFQTAVSLAEYDAEKDEDGKILVNDDHFRAVVELSGDFKEYLDTLHKKDEAQRAAFKHERYDEFVKEDQ